MTSNNKFQELSNTDRIWAVGSLHSSIDSFQSIKKYILSNFKNSDKIVFLGNIIGFNNKSKEIITDVLGFRFDLMANSIYEFVWYEYCDWYLEIVKNDMTETTKNYLIYSIIRILKICHPIIPFITEEIWKTLYHRKLVDEPDLINSRFPSQIRISKEDNIYEEKHILHMIKNIRQNYPPSLWNTIYQLTKQGHISDHINDEVDKMADKLTNEVLIDK